MLNLILFVLQLLAFSIVSVADARADWSPVPGTILKEPASLDLWVSDDCTLHLVYATDSLGIVYQKSMDSGETWTAPAIVYTDLSGTSDPTPQILGSGDAITILWLSQCVYRATSTDGGSTWSTPDCLPVPGIHTYSLAAAQKDDVVALIAVTTDGWHLLLSIDAGLTWAQTEILDHGRPIANPECCPSLLLTSGSWHCTWATLVRTETEFDGILYYADGSLDRIDSYRIVRLLSGANSISPDAPRMIADAHMSALDDQRLLIAFARDGVRAFQTTNAGYSWSEPQVISPYSCSRLATEADGESTYRVSWIDERDQTQQWWGHIPLHELFTWDSDPSWADNDIYQVVLDANGDVSAPRRVTWPLSFTEERTRSLICKSCSGIVFTLWVGKEHVGRTLSSSNDPFRIYLDRQ